MGLSEFDSKKYKSILKFKQQIAALPCENILSGKPSNGNRANKQINIYGEEVVTHLTQVCKKFSAEEIQEIVSLYKEGETTYKLAKKFGCSKTTISKLLKQQGVNVTKSKVQAKLDAEKIITMYEKMYTSEQIAKQLGVSSYSIMKCLRAHGVKIRDRWSYPQR